MNCVTFAGGHRSLPYVAIRHRVPDTGFGSARTKFRNASPHHRWAALADPGRLLEGVGQLQDLEVVIVSTHDLHAHR